MRKVDPISKDEAWDNFVSAINNDKTLENYVRSQNEIIKITREMRDDEKTDSEIIDFLGLKEKVPFKMEREYLSKLYGFVTERLSKDLTGMYNHWKVYHKQELRNQ